MVRNLIARKVYYEDSMTWEEAVQPRRKRGRKTPLSPYILAYVLDMLEDNSQLTLKDLEERA